MILKLKQVIAPLKVGDPTIFMRRAFNTDNIESYLDHKETTCLVGVSGIEVEVDISYDSLMTRLGAV